jgi:hypothetical protein
MECSEIVALWLLSIAVFICMAYHLINWATGERQAPKKRYLDSRDVLYIIFGILSGYIVSWFAVLQSSWMNCAFKEDCTLKQGITLNNIYTVSFFDSLMIVGIFLIALWILFLRLRKEELKQD